MAWRSKSAPRACKFLVQAKALSIHKNLSKDDDDDNAKPFSASTGWFSKFTKRCNFDNIKMAGKAASADTVAAETFLLHYK
jgi:hypothetical protein